MSSMNFVCGIVECNVFMGIKYQMDAVLFMGPEGAVLSCCEQS